MNHVNQSRLPAYAFAVFLFAIDAAHTGTAAFLPVLALSLLAGIRGAAWGRRALFVLPAAWFLGGLFASTSAASNGHAVLSAMWFLLLGGLLAASANVSLRLTAGFAVLIGLYHGYLNGSGMGPLGTAAEALLGLAFAVFVLIALTAALVVPLQAPWARAVVRVAGSWVAASGLLMLGWALRAQ